MTLYPNTSFGRYEILSRLGVGGMGEVYLAHDTKLERSIALKILPSDVAANDERMRRFTQEAKAAAALNHPNIAHIYEIGEIDGTHFIAMEYIDGVTLTEKIHREKTTLRKLLKYLTQTAEGLAKAHAAGIVHRDLKPDNIMITRDDYTKILDFGLAKLIEPQRPAGVSGETATAILAQHSTPGMIMGTVGYMSPEQAQGKVREIDHRSDVFSFGCILYEAATGQKAFAGKDPLDSLHKIVHAPAPQIRDVNPVAPDDLQRIVRRCLAKDPDKRYQSIKDVAIELDELRQDLKNKADLDYSVSPESAGGARVGISPSSKVDNTQPSIAGSTRTDSVRSASSAEYLVSGITSHKKTAAIVLITLLVVLGGIGIAVIKFWRKADRPPPAITIQRLTGNGKVSQAAISPDGKFLAYAQNEGSEQSLWVKQITTNSNVQVIAPAVFQGYSDLSFGPDGSYIYFAGRNTENPVSTIFRVPTFGGSVSKVMLNGSVPSFSPDGKQFVFGRWDDKTTETALFVANADGSNERKLISLFKTKYFNSLPVWSPDGKLIACSIGDDERLGSKQTLVVVGVLDGALKELSEYKWDVIASVVWLPDMSGLVFSADDDGGGEGTFKLWQISYPGGESRRLTQDLTSYANISLTADGKALVAIERESTSNIWVSPNADVNAAIPVATGKDVSRGISWTPDKRVVYVSTGSGKPEVWIMNSDGSNQKQLTNDGRIKYTPVVSSDGRYIVYGTSQGGADLWRINLDGNNPTLLTDKSGDEGDPDISPDGKWIIYSRWYAGKQTLWRLPIDGGEAKQLTDYSSTEPNVSPDGKHIACYFLDEKNIFRLGIVPFEGGAPIKTLTLPPYVYVDMSPKWMPDGLGITYVDRQNLWLLPIDGSAAKQLTDYKQGRLYRREWTRDGKQVAIVRGESTNDVVMITDFK